MTETLAHVYSSEGTQLELLNENQLSALDENRLSIGRGNNLSSIPKPNLYFSTVSGPR